MVPMSYMTTDAKKEGLKSGAAADRSSPSLPPSLYSFFFSLTLYFSLTLFPLPHLLPPSPSDVWSPQKRGTYLRLVRLAANPSIGSLEHLVFVSLGLTLSGYGFLSQQTWPDDSTLGVSKAACLNGIQQERE